MVEHLIKSSGTEEEASRILLLPVCIYILYMYIYVYICVRIYVYVHILYKHLCTYTYIHTVCIDYSSEKNSAVYIMSNNKCMLLSRLSILQIRASLLNMVTPLQPDVCSLVKAEPLRFILGE